jgi:hypothetical protein
MKKLSERIAERKDEDARSESHGFSLLPVRFSSKRGI